MPCDIEYIDPCEEELRNTLLQIPDTITLRRAFLLLTRVLWLTADNFGRYREQLSTYLYSSDESKRKLLVDLAHNADPSLTQIAIPAIYVGVGAFQYTQAVIGDLSSLSDDTSRQVFTTRGENLVQWMHYGQHADQTAAMAEVTQGVVGGFGPLLVKYLGLDNYRVVSMSPPIPRKNSDGTTYFQVNVAANFKFNNSIVVATESLRIKKILGTLTPSDEPS